jgi:uncharacterized protein
MQKLFANKKFRSGFRLLLWVLLVQFILINLSAWFYAHKFTHSYDTASPEKYYRSPENFAEKTWRIFSGPKFFKAPAAETPAAPYSTISLQTASGLPIEGWLIPADSAAKGTVVLFHGLSQNKSEMLSYANEFRYWGYHTLLIDFRAHGNSGGHTTTMGYREAEEVKLAYDFVKQKYPGPIFLWGGSMGAAAIIKAIADYQLQPAGIIAEIPFYSLNKLIQVRARTVGFSGMPEKPFGSLITFWAGMRNKIKPFAFSVPAYAEKVICPVLVQAGEKDYMTPLGQTEKIFASFAGKEKKLVVYKAADHQSLLKYDTEKWRSEVSAFLSQYR